VGEVRGRLVEKIRDKLFTVKYVEDTGHAHIEIVDQAVCGTKCKGKYCNHFCPAGVYEWDEEQQKNLVSFGNCIECGACSIGCPFDNITCHSPRGGFGAQYRLG
jgi:ferredoxin like protein